MARRWLAAAIAVAIQGFAVTAGAQDGSVNTLGQLFKRLGACWLPPPGRAGDPGMEITVLLSFRRDGSLLGKPSITYESRDVSDEDRIRYEAALARTLQRCTPMPFTDQLGGAVAGRPLRMRFNARTTKST